NVYSSPLMVLILIMYPLLQEQDVINHSLRFILTGSAGVTNLPEFVSVVKVDELEMVYCDSKRAEPKQDWLKFFKENNREHVSAYTAECNKNRIFFRKTINVLIKCCNIHIFQRMSGCEWDDATGTVNTFDQYHYDENFIAFDLETETLTTPTPWARNAKHELDSNKIIIPNIKSYLTQECLVWLKKYLDYGKSFLLRTVLPSVSLLQKRCSPVSCHATGFYPYKVDMFWRKDGEELHEDVGKGEILPNNDGTFQMSVDLKLSSVKPEDWSRYDCVFQLSGVKEDVVTKLDKAVIRTNDYFILASPDLTTTPIIVAMLVLTVCLILGTVFITLQTVNGERGKVHSVCISRFQ
uniref:Ig-like domain-containing protein n=1 Tax=Monopterus albus TaxID=43700 RepID=A0A3Q3IKX3_MONAL